MGAAASCQRTPEEHAAPRAKAALKNPPEAAREARQLCEALHAYPAARKAACCGRAPEGGLVEQCTLAVQRSLEGGARLDDARLASCKKALERRLTGCAWVTPTHPSLPAECMGILGGTLAEGAGCHSSLECQSPLHCEASSLGALGVCRPPAESGAACHVGVDGVASYLFEHSLEETHPSCREHCSLVTHRCEATPALGSACFSSTNCAAGMSCHAGHCSSEPSRAEGEECISAGCATGLRCSEGRCRALAQSGERCENDRDCAEGGCVEGAEGRVCGMKCSVSLDDLRAARPFKLPLRPRATHDAVK